MAHTARFAWRFARPYRDPRREREVWFPFEDTHRNATVYLPRSPSVPGPAWVLLHGVTVPGRHHEALRRMARALAEAGHLAFVPEIPSWTALHVDPGEAPRTARAAVAALERRKDVDPDRIGLMAFSVAATWSLVLAAGPMAGRFAVVAGMSGYGDPEHMLLGMIAGEDRCRGHTRRYDPDPYGRWIMGANLLPLLQGDDYGSVDDRVAAARALHRLAWTAGKNGALSREPVYDTLIEDLQARLPPGAMLAWRILAPRSHDARPAAAQAAGLARALAVAACRRYPEFDPSLHLRELRTPAILLHGRHDALIPCTGTLRLASLLPPEARRLVTITRLIGHTKSGEAHWPRNPFALAGEGRNLWHTFDALLDAVERPRPFLGPVA